MNQIFFHLSSLSSVNWQVKLIPPLWNCNIRIRSVKADLVFNSKFYMYFGYSLNRGMLQALQSLPFLLILSHFIQITMYDFIQFSCFKHWNLHAVTIRPNPKASPANTDNLQFLLHASPSTAAGVSAWFQACIYVLLLSELGEGEGMKEKDKKPEWPLCHHIHFSGCSPEEKLLGSHISRNSQLGFLPYSRGRTSKSTHNWFSGSSKSSRSRKIPDYNIFKTQ